MIPPTAAVPVRARFRNLKIGVTNGVEIIQCTLDIELRPCHYRADLVMIYYCSTGRPVNQRLYTRHSAHEKLRMMFQEQLTEWSPVTEKTA